MDNQSPTNESESKFSVNVSGHNYELHNMENGVQNIRFIQKEADAEGQLITVQDGTTNEAVLQVLIDRLQFLNNKMYSEYNDEALKGLKTALSSLEARTAHRVSNGVEGTNLVA